jgi:hypothetical protein
MTRTGLWFIVLTALCLLVAAASGANPFLSPDSPRQEKKDAGFRPGDYLPEPVLQAGGRALAAVIAWQGMIRHKAADVAREIKQDPLGPAFWAYLGLAFAYGVIHALGPGHGKVFVGTYFLTRNATPGQGVLAGVVIGFLHVFSAVFFHLPGSAGARAVVHGVPGPGPGRHHHRLWLGRILDPAIAGREKPGSFTGPAASCGGHGRGCFHQPGGGGPVFRPVISGPASGHPLCAMG